MSEKENSSSSSSNDSEGEEEENITFESFTHLKKFEDSEDLDIDDFVAVLLQINALRKQSMQIPSFESLPEPLASLRQNLEIKEGESKRLVHELTTLVERHARMAKGEGGDLLLEVPPEARNIVKKGLVRLMKSGAYGKEYGMYTYDWRVEKELANDSGKPQNENLVFIEVKKSLPEKIDRTEFVLKQAEFGKLWESMSELREKALQMLGQ